MAEKTKKASKGASSEEERTISVSVDGNKNQMTVKKVDGALIKQLARNAGIGKFKVKINGAPLSDGNKLPDIGSINTLELKSIDEAA